MSRNDDFDGDGHAELLISSPWGFGLLEMDANTMRAPVMAPNGTRFGGWNLQTVDNRFGPVGDFDGDGRAEIVFSSPWGIGILEQRASTMTPLMMAPNGTRFGGWNLQTSDNRFEKVGDFDGDGRAELLITSPWGIGILELAGSTLAAPMMAPNGTRFDGWNLQTSDNRFGPVGDYNGDGQTEILVSSPWGMGVLQQRGNTMRALMLAPNGTRFGGWNLQTSDNYFRIAADFDGDGRAELLVTSPWGIGILKFNGTTFRPVLMAANGTRLGGWIVDTASNMFGPAADFDGDGRAELLLTSPWGMGVLKLNGSTTATPVMAANGVRLGGWVVDTRNNRFGPAADYNGDGRAEVVATSPWGLGVLSLNGTAPASPVMAPNGTRFGGWNLQTVDNRFGGRRPCFDFVVVHFKTLVAPSAAVNTFIDSQFKEMEQLFGDVGVAVYQGTTEDLSGTAALSAVVDLDVGPCQLGQPTAEHNTLFANRNGAGANDLVVYVVRSLTNAAMATNLLGCATHPANQPGVAVVQSNARWLLAHEVGHVLGLRHWANPPATNSRFLMFPNVGWTDAPPDVVQSEVATMAASAFTRPF
ncbi:FG-GAP-like repeat-containing protein [Rhodococcus tukisamuensis]|uniref:Repeat domain-containing protein n=1 Tax=Rhodococcus tukisamuensis TaxID=168276 RepID=A0A1G7DEM4_9NOCA|nr:FG-GAP-like repeat-containing protein [Rhodococcus tukisamuensis]SDE50044.1 Repeat domain-containing protein [Rhodococcus tukisamuensis]